MRFQYWFSIVSILFLVALIDFNVAWGSNSERPRIELISSSPKLQLLSVISRRQLPAVVTIMLRKAGEPLRKMKRRIQSTPQRVYPLSIADPGLYNLRVTFKSNNGIRTIRRAQMLNLASDGLLPKSPPARFDLKHPICPQRDIDRVFALINQARNGTGLNLLSLDQRLIEAAQIHSDRMADSQKLSHEGWFEEIIQSGFQGHSYGQNIAAFQQSADELVNDWLGSPTHKAEILKTGLTATGIGCSIDPQGRYWWTQDFGG